MCDNVSMPRLRRTRTVEPSPPVNPITNQPYGQEPPKRDDEMLAAGQLALANAIPPKPVAVRFDPARTGWRGARD